MFHRALPGRYDAFASTSQQAPGNRTPSVFSCGRSASVIACLARSMAAGSAPAKARASGPKRPAFATTSATLSPVSPTISQPSPRGRSGTVAAGTVVVDPEANGREYLAVLEGELEVQRENITASGADEIQFGRLMKSAGTKAIVLMHTIPRRSCVRAVTAARILQLDGVRVEALLDWIRRGDARRKPVKFRQ